MRGIRIQGPFFTQHRKQELKKGAQNRSQRVVKFAIILQVAVPLQLFGPDYTHMNIVRVPAHTYMYVIYAHMSIYMYIFIHTYIYTYIHVYIHTHTFAQYPSQHFN
jgi:hypothetical protein